MYAHEITVRMVILSEKPPSFFIGQVVKTSMPEVSNKDVEIVEQEINMGQSRLIDRTESV